MAALQVEPRLRLAEHELRGLLGLAELRLGRLADLQPVQWRVQLAELLLEHVRLVEQLLLERRVLRDDLLLEHVRLAELLPERPLLELLLPERLLLAVHALEHVRPGRRHRSLAEHLPERV